MSKRKTTPSPRKAQRPRMTKLKDAAEDFLAQMTQACSPSKPAEPKSKPAPILTIGGKTYDYDQFEAEFGSIYDNSSSSKPPAGYTVPPTHTPPKQQSYQSYPSYSAHAGLIMVKLDETTFDGPWKVGTSYKDWWAEAIKHYPPTDGTIIVPRDRVGFTYGQVKFNACVFNATEDYLKARHGRSLHFSDKEWLAQHQLATDDGVPQEYMALCIHAMLEPYGMGVSAMRVRKGLLAIGESMQTFMDALGVNPFAMVDRQTSNKDAAEKLGMSLEDANKMWRFEFTDAPLTGCSIIAEKGWSNGNGVQTGYQGGHARYLAPRAKEGNWAVSIQCDSLDRIDYYVAPVVPEYKPRKGEATLDLGSVLQPDGKAPVAVAFRNSYYSPEVAAQKKADADKPSTSHGNGKKEKEEQETIVSVTVEGDRRKIVTKRGPTTTTRYEVILPGDSTPPKAPFSTTADVLAQHSRTADTPLRGSANTSEYTGHSRPQMLGGLEAPATCTVCAKVTTWGECCDGTDICLDCWDKAWSGYKCPHKGCEVRWDLAFTPWFLERDGEKGETRFECPNRKCRGEIIVSDTETAPHLKALVELSSYCPEMSAEEFTELRDDYLTSQFEGEEDDVEAELAKAYGVEDDDIVGYHLNDFLPKD